MTSFDPVHVAARQTLPDALDALGKQRAGIVLVGAQAIYLRVGTAGLSITPYTTDVDLGLRPELLAPTPELAACMRSAGFEHADASSVGIWVVEHDIQGSPPRVQVDLLVPEAVGGPGDEARGSRRTSHGWRGRHAGSKGRCSIMTRQ